MAAEALGTFLEDGVRPSRSNTVVTAPNEGALKGAVGAAGREKLKLGAAPTVWDAAPKERGAGAEVAGTTGAVDIIGCTVSEVDDAGAAGAAGAVDIIGGVTIMVGNLGSIIGVTSELDNTEVTRVVDVTGCAASDIVVSVVVVCACKSAAS